MAKAAAGLLAAVGNHPGVRIPSLSATFSDSYRSPVLSENGIYLPPVSWCGARRAAKRYVFVGWTRDSVQRGQ